MIEDRVPSRPSGSSSIRTVKQIIIAIIVLLVLIVMFQNLTAVTFYFLFWQASISLVFLIPLVFLVGFVIGLLVYSLIARQKRPVRT